MTRKLLFVELSFGKDFPEIPFFVEISVNLPQNLAQI